MFTWEAQYPCDLVIEVARLGNKRQSDLLVSALQWPNEDRDRATQSVTKVNVVSVLRIVCHLE